MKWIKRILKSIRNFFTRKKVIHLVINDNLSNLTDMRISCEGHIIEDGYDFDPKLN